MTRGTSRSPRCSICPWRRWTSASLLQKDPSANFWRQMRIRPAASAVSPAPDIWLGLDTGGTYTDAIALDGERRVIASAKALTTHWDLSIGLAAAVRAVLAELPQGVRREHISLVSVSTTLATNAVVENRFSPICTILIGFDDRMVERSDLHRQGTGLIVRVRGGHDATGLEAEPLDE